MEAAVKLNPKEHLLWRNLGDTYQMMPGHGEDAKRSYHQAVAAAEAWTAVNPRDARTQASLALYWAKLGDSAKASAAIARTDELKSKDLTALFYTTVASELIGKRSQALARLSSVVNQGYALERVTSAPELANLRASKEYSQLRIKKPSKGADR